MPRDADFAPARDWEIDWLARLQANDVHQWKALFRCVAPRLRQDIRVSVRKRGLPEDVTDDIEGETWHVVVQKIGAFQLDDPDPAEGIHRLYHWMRVIALNRVRMLRRREKAPALSLDALLEEDGQAGKSPDAFSHRQRLFDTSAEKKVLIREQVRELQALLALLSPRDREILMRRLVGDEPPRRLAAEYGIAPRSISQILFRAKQTLGRYGNPLES